MVGPPEVPCIGQQCGAFPELQIKQMEQLQSEACPASEHWADKQLGGLKVATPARCAAGLHSWRLLLLAQQHLCHMYRSSSSLGSYCSPMQARESSSAECTCCLAQDAQDVKAPAVLSAAAAADDGMAQDMMLPLPPTWDLMDLNF